MTHIIVNAMMNYMSTLVTNIIDMLIHIIYLLRISISLNYYDVSYPLLIHVMKIVI